MKTTSVYQNLKTALKRNPQLAVEYSIPVAKFYGAKKPHELLQAIKQIELEGEYRVYQEVNTYRQNGGSCHQWEPDTYMIYPKGSGWFMRDSKDKTEYPPDCVKECSTPETKTGAPKPGRYFGEYSIWKRSLKRRDWRRAYARWF